MPNKFLLLWDKVVWSFDKIAKICKRINNKIFYPVLILVVYCTAVAFLGEKSLEKIKFLESSFYDTIVAFNPEFVHFLTVPLGKAVSGVLLVLFLLCFLLKVFYRPCALLIAHSTMGHTLVLAEDIKKKFWFEREDITYELPDRDAPEEHIRKAIEKQDTAFENIKIHNWRSTIFYFGVAHTPLIFRLGYQFGQKANIRLLHRFRPNGNEQEFVELPPIDNDKLARLKRARSNFEIQSNELLVAISTSYPIIEDNLRAIDPDGKMYRYWVQVADEDNGVDFFNSYHKIRSYAGSFEEDIEKLVRHKNIKTVHIVISSSVSFTFYLGQLMNNNQFEKIIVYHYDHTRFTWGIDIMERNPEKAIVWVPGARENSDGQANR